MVDTNRQEEIKEFMQGHKTESVTIVDENNIAITVERKGVITFTVNSNGELDFSIIES